MQRQRDTEEAYKIIRRIDDMFHQGRFEEVNNMLGNLVPENLTELQLLSYLAATRPHSARANLPNRTEFYRKVKETLEHRERPVKELLAGLE